MMGRSACSTAVPPALRASAPMVAVGECADASKRADGNWQMSDVLREASQLTASETHVPAKWVNAGHETGLC